MEFFCIFLNGFIAFLAENNFEFGLSLFVGEKLLQGFDGMRAAAFAQDELVRLRYDYGFPCLSDLNSWTLG